MSDQSGPLDCDGRAAVAETLVPASVLPIDTDPGSVPHSLVAVDEQLPLDADGRPLFARVWCHLIGP